MAEEEIWRHVSLVSQDIYLRSSTLRENLRYVANDASVADIMEACHLAGLTEMLSNLPDGLDTKVGNQGRRFSGGERQRISIARALLKNSDILVLDEATSQLDSVNEAEVLASIESLRSSKAVLVIAHRQSAVAQSDKVIMIEDGVVGGRDSRGIVGFDRPIRSNARQGNRDQYLTQLSSLLRMSVFCAVANVRCKIETKSCRVSENYGP
jgi:ABC-type multidrug transport system fused ATPase/permease subunit